MTQYTYVSPVTGVWAAHDGNVFHAGRSYTKKGVATRWHSGNDLNSTNGSDVVAVIGGKVLYAGHNSGYNANALVLGDDGMIYRYAAHAAISVKTGQRVEQGGKIGTIGENHLHFEVIPPTSYVYSQMVDPKNLGKFIDTQTYPGDKVFPTIDPMKFFGAQRFEPIEAGQPIGDVQRREYVPSGKPTEVVQPDVKMLAGVMLAEARGEGPEGMLRVGWTVQNRIDDKTGVWGNTIRDVVLQGGGSQYARGMTQDQVSPALWSQAVELAKGIKDRSVPDITNKATYFATPAAAKSNRDFRRIAATNPFKGQFGGHVFYGEAKTGVVVPKTNTFGPYLNELNQIKTLTPEQQARIPNARLMAEANWAAEEVNPEVQAPVPERSPAVDPIAVPRTVAEAPAPATPIATPVPVASAPAEPESNMDKIIRSRYADRSWDSLPAFAKEAITQQYGADAQTKYEQIRKSPSPTAVVQPASLQVVAPAKPASGYVPPKGKWGEDQLVTSWLTGDQASMDRAKASVDANIQTAKKKAGMLGFTVDLNALNDFNHYFTQMAHDAPEQFVKMKTTWQTQKQNFDPAMREQIDGMLAAISPSPAVKGMKTNVSSPVQVPLPPPRPSLPTDAPSLAPASGSPSVELSPAAVVAAPPASNPAPAPAKPAVQGYSPDFSFGYGDVSPLLTTTGAGQTPIGDASKNAQETGGVLNLGTPLPQTDIPPLPQTDIPPFLKESLGISANPSEPAEPNTPPIATPAIGAPPPPILQPAMRPKPQPAQQSAPQVARPQAASSQGNSLLSAAGGGKLETQPSGMQIAVHTHDDGGVTTSYPASDGHIITIHTDANGDTTTLSG